MSRFSTLVGAPKAGWINKGLSPLKLKTVRAGLGEARKSYSDKCQPATGELLLKHLVTDAPGFKPRLLTKAEREKRKREDVIPNGPEETWKTEVLVTGVKPAVESLARILAKVEENHPELWQVLGHAGMTCCRKIRGGSDPSRHSWGLAIELTIDGKVDPLGDDLVQQGLLTLYRYFHEEGWYWGAGFDREDAMHFEVSDQLLKSWMAKGLISR